MGWGRVVVGTEKTADEGRIKTRDKEFRNVEYLEEGSFPSIL